jgi:hypothetical protein
MTFPAIAFLLIVLSLSHSNAQWVRLSDISLGSMSPSNSEKTHSRFVTVGGQRVGLSNDRPNPLSIGGDYIRKDEAPWLCPIFRENEHAKSEYICGSSLISKSFVLTGEIFFYF